MNDAQLEVPSAKAIRDLRGMEFIYKFTEGNGTELDGKVTDAYVAEADINIGITIKGRLPVGIDYEAYGLKNVNDDVVLQCCACNGAHNASDVGYIAILHSFMAGILSGVMSDDCCTGGGDVTHMEASCGF